MALAQEFTGVGTDALPDGLELFGRHITRKAEHLGAAAYALTFGIVITAFERYSTQR